ncbi:MAG: prolyl aminopeptidase [Methylococcaceae bacterium]
MNVLYPPIDPYRTHSFVRDGHKVYVEECGNPMGFPVLFLHGGPGAGCKDYHRCFFNPQKYRIILLDQRGSGRSLPHGELERNTTADLLDDLDAVRHELKVSQWLLFGGSWGATLALLCAQRQVGAVAGLILRGTFLARPADLDWFVGPNGVRRIYPDYWAYLLAAGSAESCTEVLLALYDAVTGPDELAQRRAARAWELWSGRVLLGEKFDPRPLDEHVTSEALNQARIELHYARHQYFIEDNAVLAGCPALVEIPTIIIHGRRDLVCPVDAAWCLRQALPQASLEILPEAGHIAAGSDMINALVGATDSMARQLGL